MAAPILIFLGALAVGACLKETREVGPPADGDLPGDGDIPSDDRNNSYSDSYVDGNRDAGLDLGPDACTAPTLFRDFDEDGFGNPEEPSEACAISKEGYVDNDRDCDDEAETINPDAMELHNDGVDNDCDGIVDIDSWRMTSTGDQYSCGLRLDGRIRCWGSDEFGQRTIPPEYSEEIFTQVSTGAHSSYGLSESGRIFCWGRNSEGQCSLPPELAGETFNFVSGGWFNACGIKAVDSTPACWGNNDAGQSTIQPEIEEESVFQIRSGGGHSCILKADETVFCWGSNDQGQSDNPGGRFAEMTAGLEHNCGMSSSDNTVFCWGNNNYGQRDLPPALLEEPFVEIAAGPHNNCGILTDGAVRCWGRNDAGQATDPEGAFIYVGHSKGSHLCGVTADNTVRCWGNNDQEQAPELLTLTNCPDCFL